jgi:hypothetical protein
VVPPALGLLLLVAELAGPGAVGVGLFALALVALLLTIAVHLHLERAGHGAAQSRHRPQIVNPAQVAVATFVVVTVGATIAALGSIVVAALAPSLVGDGSSLLRLFLVVFALAPCVSIGSRCGRWWAFTGGAGAALLAGTCVIATRRSPDGLGFLLLTAVAIAFAVATGSLRRRLAAPRGSRRRERSAPVSGSGERGPARLPADTRERVARRSAAL